jgi:tetratricopeptide (TPR) repeat protein
MGVVQGADSWTISAYQRAITLDPQNPQYRVALGGVMYGLKQYEDASRLFEQAVILKSDWSNAQYNYAWALAQKGSYQQAATAMQACLSLLNPTRDAADYKKAAADLEEFKKKIPVTDENQESKTQTTQPGKETLTLPSPAESLIDPKITIPDTASPEAK